MDPTGYKKLRVWTEAHKLVLLIYQITKTFPKDEIFGIISQIRRAAVSVVANIVEGQARASKKEFLQFLYVANGSLVEVEYYLELTKDLRYLTENQYREIRRQQIVVGNLLNGLIKSLKKGGT